ncbi:MAG: hypothetical protein J7L12_02280 [Desulfurococcales archaeon]|nr:hypothetical protein [Desulfurococcales archaeon]
MEVAWLKGPGRKKFTDVRVLRGRKPVASDHRAITLYEANNSEIRLNVYRLKSVVKYGDFSLPEKLRLS